MAEAYSEAKLAEISAEWDAHTQEVIEGIRGTNTLQELRDAAFAEVQPPINSALDGDELVTVMLERTGVTQAADFELVNQAIFEKLDELGYNEAKRAQIRRS